MRRTSAWLMLAVMALWAAVPAFACLTPAQQDDCCRQMMQASSTCDMGADQSCCQVHGRESGPPLAAADLADRSLTLVFLTAADLPEARSAPLGLPQPVVASVTPASRSGASVLRI